MTRLFVAFLFPLLAAACATTPTATPSPPPAATATLRVTGSGELCGPWWFGCGAVFAIEQPGWTLPDDWAPSARDTQFDVDLHVDTERAASVTGVREPGRDRIEPGDYLFVGILTRSPDSETPATTHATVGCSKAMTVPPGTNMVSVAVAFSGDGCTIEVAMDDRTPMPIQ